MPETVFKSLAYLIDTKHRYSHNTNSNVATIWITSLKIGSWCNQHHSAHVKLSGCLNKHVSHMCFIKVFLQISNPKVSYNSHIGKDMER